MTSDVKEHWLDRWEREQDRDDAGTAASTPKVNPLRDFTTLELLAEVYRRVERQAARYDDRPGP